jgi:hypothetical protein
VTTRRFAALAAVFLLVLAASTSSRALGSGSVSLTALDSASTQDFDSLD